MGSCSEIEDGFFDARDVFVSMSDSESERSTDDCSTSGFKYESWVGNLDSVDERRYRFIRSIGLSSKWLARDEENEEENHEFHGGSNEIITEKPNSTLRQNPVFDDEVLIRQPSLSCWSNLAIELPTSGSLKENIRNRDELDQDIPRRQSFDFGSSSQRSSSRKEPNNGSLLDRRSKVKRGWLQKLNIIARTTDHQVEETSSSSTNCSRAVQVHTNKKKSKELSSLYATQNFPAHNGSISILKFSHDGRYLASAGEDGIVRIWEITENDDPRKYEIPGNDQSSLYFSANHLSELAPIKEKNRKKIKKSSEVACVILPPKVFRILEKPVHEFHGHGGEILSLSWSKRGYLLSSSVDKTVRMWRIGHDKCLKVFTHSNYVTSVDFNPVNDNYFISGSIDGKVRIWEVHGCHVIDWIEIREIVTAVCYYADGKGCIVGTLDGNCSFYDIISMHTCSIDFSTLQLSKTFGRFTDTCNTKFLPSDKQLHLDAQISIMCKRKWPRRITGFQVCPADSRKVIVSSADSQVRVLCGVNVVGKFKGNRSSGSQISASFTSDGKHIVSAGDDSNIYIWDHASPDKLYTKPKSNLSTESFFSQEASVAIPWCGIKSIAAAFPSPRPTYNTTESLPRSTIKSPRSTIKSPRSTIKSPRIPTLSISRSFFKDSLLRGNPPTWPSETLPDSTQVSVSPSMRKSEYKFLRNAYRNTFVAPHTWGLVIVAAGLDGRIRTYVNYGLPVRM